MRGCSGAKAPVFNGSFTAGLKACSTLWRTADGFDKGLKACSTLWGENSLGLKPQVSRLRRLNAFCMRTHTSGFANPPQHAKTARLGGPGNARFQCGLTCGRAAGAWSMQSDTSLARVHIFRGNNAALKGRSSTVQLYAANSLHSPLPEGKGWGRSSTTGVR
jgi:hypothetical protein